MFECHARDASGGVHGRRAGLEGQVLWRGPGLDRLVDARHAARLQRAGWEMSRSQLFRVRERGSIDLLGRRIDERAGLVEEIKSDLTRGDETLRKLDEKVRLVAAKIALDRLGWRLLVVGRLLVLPDTDVLADRFERARWSSTRHSPREVQPSVDGCGTRRARWLGSCSSRTSLRTVLTPLDPARSVFGWHMDDETVANIARADVCDGRGRSGRVTPSG